MKLKLFYDFEEFEASHWHEIQSGVHIKHAVKYICLIKSPSYPSAILVVLETARIIGIFC